MQTQHWQNGVKTPIIDSMINLANAMLDRNFYEEGYSLDYLGIGHMDADELLQYLNDVTYNK